MLLLAALRQPLADWLWRGTPAEELRDRAASALAAGHLTAPDGTGARELYEAALAMDPDQLAARQGLARVAIAAVEQAELAIDETRHADAHAWLRLARELSAPRTQVDAAAGRLRQAELAEAGLDAVWVRAQAAHAAGDLIGHADAALPLYQRILQWHPDDADVLRAREDALGELLQGARERLRLGDHDEAATTVAIVRGFDPGHVDLADTEARLAEELDALQRAAWDDLENGLLESALDRFQRYRAAGGDSGIADRGTVQVAAAYAGRARRYASDFRFAEAEATLAQARMLAPDSNLVRDAAEEIEDVRAAYARIGTRLSPQQRREQVREYLQQAAAAEARGDLLTPPGDSAYDKLRAAHALDPDSAEVREASVRILEHAEECFERELRGNSLGRARACLDVLAALDMPRVDIRDAQRRLAARWLAIGDERLVAGDVHGAALALEHARQIDASTPGIEAFTQRLRVARSESPG